MRIGISNLAWNTNDDHRIAKILQDFQIDAIDIVPGKYFPIPQKATEKEMSSLKEKWANYGIELVGMQALLFGKNELNIFGPPASRVALHEHFSALCKIAKCLGTQKLVFGSPKNRDCSGLTEQETRSIAIPFFRTLGSIAERNNVIICLEPNPACYNATYLLNSFDTAQVVKEIDHPAIKMQFDTGALTLNKEDPNLILAQFSEIIGHIHASEPYLLPLGEGGVNHDSMALAIKKYLPTQIISIEMIETKNEPSEVSIKRALSSAIQAYRNYKMPSNDLSDGL